MLFIKKKNYFQFSSNILKTKEDDPDLEEIPRDLVQTSFKSLVVSTGKPNIKQMMTKSYQNRTRNPKNTKTFRKVCLRFLFFFGFVLFKISNSLQIFGK